MNNTTIKEFNRFKRKLMKRVLGVFWSKIMEIVKIDNYDEPATNIIQRRR